MGAQERIRGPGVQSQYCSAPRPHPVSRTSGRASVSPYVSRKDGSGWISSGAESEMCLVKAGRGQVCARD